MVAQAGGLRGLLGVDVDPAHGQTYRSNHRVSFAAVDGTSEDVSLYGRGLAGILALSEKEGAGRTQRPNRLLLW